jgi:hypothetical protein
MNQRNGLIKKMMILLKEISKKDRIDKLGFTKYENS